MAVIGEEVGWRSYITPVRELERPAEDIKLLPDPSRKPGCQLTDLTLNRNGISNHLLTNREGWIADAHIAGRHVLPSSLPSPTCCELFP